MATVESTPEPEYRSQWHDLNGRVRVCLSSYVEPVGEAILSLRAHGVSEFSSHQVKRELRNDEKHQSPVGPYADRVLEGLEGLGAIGRTDEGFSAKQYDRDTHEQIVSQCAGRYNSSMPEGSSW